MKQSLVIFIFLVAACHNKEKATNAAEQAQTTASISATAPVGKTSEKKALEIERSLREALYFAASIEREAIKLILKGESSGRNTLFSVLSYVIETKSGSKRSAPMGLDCSRYNLERTKGELAVYKVCGRNPELVATIKTIRDKTEYEIIFEIGAWKSVVGLSVTLTNPNTVCKIGLVQEKISSFTCQYWALQTTQDQLSSTVIKINEFEFNRKAARQLLVRGGFFKELVQNKKIDIEVPLDGKIRIIEKELKVIDEFSAYTNEAAAPPVPEVITQPTTEQKTDSNGVLNEQKSKEESNKENQTQPQGEGVNQESQNKQVEPTQEIQQQDQSVENPESQNGGQPPSPETRSRGR